MTPRAQHDELTLERWRATPFDQQVLMIANEMNRASAMLDHRALDRARSGYEPLLALTDLMWMAQRHAADAGSCCAGVTWQPAYVSPTISPDAHRQAFRALLQLTPGSARQTPFLLGSA